MSVGVNTIRQELTGSVMSSPTQTEIVANHRRAVRFFWCFLIGATTVSLIGNIEERQDRVRCPASFIQIGAAAVPPIALLAAVHGIALAVRAGASGRVYGWCLIVRRSSAVQVAMACCYRRSQPPEQRVRRATNAA